MRASLGVIGAALLAVVCCAALPLLVAASISVAALAWGGVVAGAIVAVAGFSFFLRHRARERVSGARLRESRPPSPT